jgi:alanine dehydrogenase
MDRPLAFGFARMHQEAGERRDFLPDTISLLDRMGVQVFLERGYGAGMGLCESDYRLAAPSVTFASAAEVYQLPCVVVLRCPDDADLRRLLPGACLISMLHYSTRPQRTQMLRGLGIEAISLDSLKDDVGRRLVENLRAVAWNGVEAAIRVLRTLYPPPGFESPRRPPIHVTLLGTGAVGVHVMQAAIRYGDAALWREMIDRGAPGVQVTSVDYDTTNHKDIMLDILRRTDILVDATQRPDPSRPVIPNEWIAVMPAHAVMLDLSVDPYDCDSDQPRAVKGIEGIPHGDLDQYTFAPGDPAYDRIPACVPTIHRRYAVSCFSWPGIHPRECMSAYGKQLRPIFRTLIEKGGADLIDPRGSFFERVISRAMLSRWHNG